MLVVLVAVRRMSSTAFPNGLLTRFLTSRFQCELKRIKISPGVDDRLQL